MSSYTGKSTLVAKSAGELYQRLSNLDNLQGVLDRIPDDRKAGVGEISVADGVLSLSTPMGNIAFEVIETREPALVVYGAKASPVPLRIEVHLTPVTVDSTDVSASVDVELPAMLRAMLGSKLQGAADKFGEMVALFCQ